MKKFLSLVLALAMTLSLVTISAGAKDFADESDIDYDAAVDVISELGIVSGYGDNSFRPDGLLTRGAAAKIICNLILGPTTAGALQAGTAPFKDVPTTNTFAGYITYCAQQGIISGYGDGTFRPSGSLTGNAFMKMLLGALGYSSSIEGYTGANWQVNVVKQAIGIGLDDGNDNFVGSANVTRGEAALYAYNMLQATMVEYDNQSTIVVGDIHINTSSARDEVSFVGVGADTDGNISRDGKVQFAERYFKDLSKRVGTQTDDFERPSTTWRLKSKTIGTYADTPDLVYTEKVEMGDIYADLGLGKTLTAANLEFYVNGNTADTGVDNDGNNLSSLNLSRGSKREIGGNGTLVEVYYDDTTDPATADIIVIDTYAGEITSVRGETSSRDANVTVTPLNAGRGGNYDTEDFEVDDIVTYNYSNKSGDAGVKNVALAETITGELEGYTDGKTVTVAGDTYKFGANADIDAADLKAALDNDVTVTLDQYGFVLDVDTEATSTNYAVVLKYSDADTWNDARAELLFTDGKTERVNLDKNYDQKSGTDKLAEGTIVSYTINRKDQYVLKVLEDPKAAAANDQITENGSYQIDVGSVTRANGKTIFLVASKSGDDTIYTAYTGIANVPTITVKNAAVINGYVKSGTAATVVYINATNASISSSSKDVVFIVSDNDKASHNSEKGEYYRHDAIVNGDITEIDLDKPYNRGLYTIMTVDGAGVASLGGSTKNEGVYKGSGTDREANGAIGLNGNWYTYSDDCEVFYVDADDNVTVSSISGITKDETDRVFWKETNGEVTTIVICESVTGAKDITGGITYIFTDNDTVSRTDATPSIIGTNVTVTTTGAHTGWHLEISDIEVSAGATWSVVGSNSAEVMSNGGSATADNQIEVEVTAENGKSTVYTITFQAKS